MISPGGEFDVALEDVGASTYRASYVPNRRPQTGATVPVGMYPVEEDAPTSTQGRVVVDEYSDPIYRTGESHYTATHGTEADLQRQVVQALRSRQRTREEHEHRWRQWQQRQKRSAKAGTVVSDATSVSVMPAGLRRAKGANHQYDGPMRVALFNEDVPRPIWTTLASAPWALEMGV